MGLFVRWTGALAACSFVVAAAACSSKDNGFGDSGSIGEVDAGEDTAPSCGGRRCSRDLHDVVDDCTEAVVESCGANRGCAAGACVPACEAAVSSQGSIGCSFYTVPPDTLVPNETSCYAAFVANTWNTPVAVRAEFGGTPLDISKSIYRAVAQGDQVTYERLDGTIPPGELGIVFLNEGIKGPNNREHLGCPAGVEVARHGSVVTSHGTSIYPTFFLTTSVPVSAYSLFPYGGAGSYVPAATLLLPTSSWDTNYILVDGWGKNAGYPFVQIVAQEDDTEVRLRPKVDVLDGEGVQGGVRNSVVKWNLQRGQVLEIGQDQSLIGSPIESSHPVAVFGGNQCAFVPDDSAWCDSLHQQIAPIHAWSSSYSAVPYKSRLPGLGGTTAPENVIWRVVGAADGTVLSYDPVPPGAPSTLQSGEVATFTADQAFQVKSQDSDHPFFLAVYMSGAEVYRTAGDPDFVTIVPNDQFLDHYVFFLDHTYAESNLTVVRRKSRTGFHDVTLDCLGPVTGWQPLGTDGTTEFAYVDMTVGRAPVSTPLGFCGYGRHEVESDGPFALYAWGLDRDASYGFPAGAGIRPTTTYTVPVN